MSTPAIPVAPPAALPPVAQRFWRYVQIDTTSDPGADATPSTERQKVLGQLLVDELEAMGATDPAMDDHGYVYATLSATTRTPGPVLALLAHLDTSPDAPGAGVTPVLHPAYDGSAVPLPGDPSVVLDPERQPALRDHVGHDLITSDGTTLLGSDDKAGVAVLMQLAAELVADPSLPCPTVRLCFTVDEEIGRGVDKLDLERLGADVAYTLDGSGRDTLYTETFNAAEATVTVEGVAVHPGYAKDVMVNAARIVSRLVAQLPPDEAPETTAGREGYFHPHTTAEGTAQQASVRILLRDFTDEGMARRKAFLRHLVDTLRTQHPRATIDLAIEDQYRNMGHYIQASDPRVISLAHEAADSIGIDLTESIIRGGTDGARLSEMGLPTPNVFNGGPDYHSCFEWNTVQNLTHALRYTQALVATWAYRSRTP